MPSEFTVPIISALGAALIAAIVSLSIVFLTRRSETIKHLELVRTTAYVDFIRGVAGLGVISHVPVRGREHFLKSEELTMLVADAKARIAIYGSETVVAALAEFLRAGTVLDSPQRAKEFTAVCQKMRGDSRPKLSGISDRDIHFLLFDSDIQDEPESAPVPHKN